jgi:hypothetical protein
MCQFGICPEIQFAASWGQLYRLAREDDALFGRIGERALNAIKAAVMQAKPSE